MIDSIPQLMNFFTSTKFVPGARSICGTATIPMRNINLIGKIVYKEIVNSKI